MVDNPPPEVYFADNDDDNESDSEEKEADSTIEDTEDTITCVKLKLDENIAAHKEKRVLLRETEVVSCNSNLVENVTFNYIIAKQIISNLPWQEKMMCENVCSTWHSAVQALKKEQIAPEDFAVNFQYTSLKFRHGQHKYSFVTVFMQSGCFYTEPLVIMTFTNSTGLTLTCKCGSITPCPCKEPCENEHSLLDLVNQKANAPLNNMYSIKANHLSYLPLPKSITYEHAILHLRNKPFIGGVYIPMIPGVEFHTINIKSNSVSIKEAFFDVVEKIATNKIIKGVLVYVTERYLLHTVEDIIFLNYFKEIQPDVPYALGGCIIEDTVFDENDINLIVDGFNDNTDFISDNLLSIGFFSIPKTSKNIETNFDMFSLILESSDWCKPKIQQSINEFAQKVPKFEHSVAVKLSCVGRDLKHKLEQDLFRAAFPNTRIVGCYGNGELGLNHPARPTPDPNPPAAKRHKRDPGPQYGLMYSYSTVFVYIGWGKILSNPLKKK